MIRCPIQTIRLITEAVVHRLAPSSNREILVEACSAFVVNEWKRQPFHVRAVLWLFMAVYQATTSKEQSVRLRRFNRLIASPIFVVSNPAHLILNWILMSYYDHPLGIQQAGYDPETLFKSLSYFNRTTEKVPLSAIPLKDQLPTKVDYLVVGSGAGGALTADWLSSQGKDVLILEEGPWEYLRGEHCGLNYTFPRVWRDGGIIPILGNAKLAFAEGCCAGGSTMLNSGLFHRIPVSVRKEWTRDYGLIDLESLDHYHEQIENALSVQVIPQPLNPACMLFQQGADLCGFKGLQVPVTARGTVGHLEKQHMQATYLHSALNNGSKILTHCRAKRILFNGSRAIGVEVTGTDRRGKPYSHTIQCQNLILCAGPLQTPLLLRRSGIKHNVGNSLAFHPTLRVLADFGKTIDACLHEMPFYQVKEFAPKITLGASVSAPAFFATLLSTQWPNTDTFALARQMALYYVSITSSARGTIRNLGSSYLVRYSISDQDQETLGKGFQHLVRLLLAAGASTLYTSIENSSAIRSLSDAERISSPVLPLKRLQLMTIHAFSSCPIGENRSRCAADSFGKVFGFDNLYLNDASILPSSPTANPQGPLMALALRNLHRNFPR